MINLINSKVAPRRRIKKIDGLTADGAGVLVEASPKGVRLAATDGHVLRVVRAGRREHDTLDGPRRRTPSRRRWRGRAGVI
jgi:hypothetical protein